MLRPRTASPGSAASGCGIASPATSKSCASAPVATQAAAQAATATSNSARTLSFVRWLRERQPVVLQRQRADALAGRGEDRVADRRRNRGLAGLADPAPEASARREHHLDLGHLAQAHHAIIVEVRLLHASLADG